MAGGTSSNHYEGAFAPATTDASSGATAPMLAAILNAFMGGNPENISRVSISQRGSAGAARSQPAPRGNDQFDLISNALAALLLRSMQSRPVNWQPRPGYGPPGVGQLPEGGGMTPQYRQTPRGVPQRSVAPAQQPPAIQPGAAAGMQWSPTIDPYTSGDLNFQPFPTQRVMPAWGDAQASPPAPATPAFLMPRPRYLEAAR